MARCWDVKSNHRKVTAEAANGDIVEFEYYYVLSFTCPPGMGCITPNGLGDVSKAVFTRGKIGPAVRASTSIPQLFTPAKIDGDFICDGALAEYLPIETLDEFRCDLKFGVNLGSIRDWHEKAPGNMFEIALRTIGFVSQRNASISEKAADFVIRPDLSGFGPYELHRSDELLAAGYEAGMRAAPRLLGLIAEQQAERAEGGDWSRVIRWFRHHSPLTAEDRDE